MSPTETLLVILSSLVVCETNEASLAGPYRSTIRQADVGLRLSHLPFCTLNKLPKIYHNGYLLFLQYGIVLDAGSSHTSVYIYEWPAEKENDTGVVQQINECKVEGWADLATLPLMQQDSGWFKYIPNFKPTETSGALDLGGASTQITFESKREIESQENSLHFRLYGKSYDIYTHSFLCYGKDQALRLQIANSIKDATDSILLDPCFNSGYRRNASTNDLYSSPCISKLRIPTAPSTLDIRGTGNYQLCKRNVQAIFNRTHCTYSHCSFNGVFQPSLDGTFGAFSAYYFVMNFLNLTNEQMSLDKVKETVERHCSRPWDEVKKDFPKIKEKYLSEYCFSGTYILNLLEYGYGFSSENWNDIRFLGKVIITNVFLVQPNGTVYSGGTGGRSFFIMRQFQ
eukprot:XP_017945999.1 PREDICTED: ectonucleoside triphosphate diphosphohydrolase 1-like [Xenopus tropicalis]